MHILWPERGGWISRLQSAAVPGTAERRWTMECASVRQVRSGHAALETLSSMTAYHYRITDRCRQIGPSLGQ